MARTYRECETYRDTGFSMETYSDGQARRLEERRAFRTAFQRGKRFRFTYRYQGPFGRTYRKARIVWYDGNQTMVSSDESDEFKADESLGLAMAAITGVSAGTAHTIPALLMHEDIGGRQITEISELKPLTTEIVNERKCYRIEGEFGGDKTVLWIDASSFLLVKMVENFDISGMAYLRTTSYSPVVNENIPDRLFEKRVEGEWDDLKPGKPVQLAPE